MRTHKETLFTWVVEDYFQIVREKKIGDIISSKRFSVPLEDSDEVCTFMLKLCPNNKQDNGKEFAGLSVANCDTEDVLVNFSLYLRKNDLSMESIFNCKERKIKSRGKLGLYNAFNKLKIEEKKNEYLAKEELKIACSIEVIQNHSIPIMETNLKQTKSLSDQYADYYDINDPENAFHFEEFSDFQIICGEEVQQVFKCHKVILATGSPVFRTMFSQTNLLCPNEVHLNEIDSETMKSMLHFLYTGHVTNHMITPSLLSVADKYRIARLKALCEKQLICRLTEDNAVDITISSRPYGTPVFQEETVKFLASKWKTISQEHKNHLKEYPDLLMQVIDNYNDIH